MSTVEIGGGPAAVVWFGGILVLGGFILILFPDVWNPLIDYAQSMEHRNSASKTGLQWVIAFKNALGMLFLFLGGGFLISRAIFLSEGR